jgi:Zn-dependent protease with chaperone function
LSRQAAKGFQTMGMLERWLDQSAGGLFNPLVWLVVAYHRLFLVLWAANSRQQEYAADQFSLRQTGKKAAARSLVLVTVTDHLPWARLTSVLDSCVALKQPLDRLFAEQVQRLRGTSPGEWQDACRKALKRETGLLDTHPALKPRLAALGMSAKKALELAQAPTEPAACESIPGWAGIERDLTIRLLAVYQEVYQAKMDMAQIILGKPIER